MSGPARRPVNGVVDRDGRLVAADPALIALQTRAGGTLGGKLVVPALVGMARLARRLGLAVSRAIVAANGERDLHLWVRAAPSGDRIRLKITDWCERAPLPPPVRRRDFLRAEHDWWWRSDAALTLTALAPGAPAAAALGAPLTALLALEPDAAGRLALVEAHAEERGFVGQAARLLAAPRTRFALAAEPIRDADGRFAGFRGTASALRASPEVPSGSSPADAFGDRLGGALRAPLRRIIAAADAIGAREDGPVRRDYAGYAADIASAGRHLMALVDDLIDLSAIERPDYRLDPEPIDLADLARRAGGLLAVRALDRDVTIDAPGEGDRLPAAGDFRRALQILVNLIGNAVRYAPPGGTVRVRGEAAGDHARLIVADDGKGIAAEDQARIFEKFERVDPTEPGGTGLGLYISRRLARAMGGDLTVESAPGEGARFTLELPAK